MEARKLVGRNVRRLRVAAEIAQDELALRAGVDRAYVGKLERGVANPTVDTLEKLAAALKVDLSDFFSKVKGSALPLRGGRPTSRRAGVKRTGRSSGSRI
jgi:transcriptional regulator with XRE-family HTH domain